MNRTVEIRSYQLRSGMGPEFHRLVWETSMPMLERWKVDVIAAQPSRHNPDEYILIRSYDSPDARQKSQDAFYGSDEWKKGPRDAILALIEHYTTVVVELPAATVEALRAAFHEPESKREIVSIRVIDAPRDAIFDAWIDPARLARWWGPSGFTNTFHVFEAKPGGRWHFVMHGPDGKDYRNESEFLEIERPNRIVIRHITGPRFVVTATFAEEAGKTRLRFRQLFDTVAAYENVKSFAVEANEQNFDRLEAELTRPVGRP